jgi:hypothetical protein
VWQNVAAIAVADLIGLFWQWKKPTIVKYFRSGVIEIGQWINILALSQP